MHSKHENHADVDWIVHKCQVLHQHQYHIDINININIDDFRLISCLIIYSCCFMNLLLT